MLAKIKNIKRLLNPQSIAVVGGNEAGEVIAQCKKAGYVNDIWPVNPKRQTLQGISCYQSLRELPYAPDATFIAVPAATTIETLKTLNEIEAGGAVCYASGFAEVGKEGDKKQEQLKQATGDLAVMGPNCHGLINYKTGATLWPDQHGGKRAKNGVAIISQSGNIAINMTMQQRSLPIAYLVTVGNQACLQIHDYMRALLDDDDLTAIGLQFEGLSDVAAFSEVASLALEKKIPVVAIKAGRSALARETALSHTSSLTGPDKLYDALFERFGIARVDSISEFIETLKLLSVVGTLSGRGIATISCSGGEAALAADLAQKHSLEFPTLSDDQKADLYDVLGERVSLANPLDYHTYIWGNYVAQEGCFSAITKGVQALTLKFLDFPVQGLCDPKHWRGTAECFVNALKNNNAKGAVLSTLNESLPEETRSFLLESGVAPMQGIEECFVAVKSACLIGNAQNKPIPAALAFAESSISKGVCVKDEWESKKLLAHHGISIPKSARVSEDTAKSAVDKLSFPLVAKALSSELAHKSDAGGVHLNIKDEEELLKALSNMVHLSDTFLLEEMVKKPVAEMILGLNRDEQFGLSLTLGAGGIWTEIFDDSVCVLLPCSECEIEEALKTLKIWKVLQGARGKKHGDIEALIQTVMQLATLAQENAGDLLELDINPLMVLEQGNGTIACDALVSLAGKP